MSCPFLKETTIRYCHGSPLRKLIASVSSGTADLCAGHAHVECPVYRQHGDAVVSAHRCAYLHESLAHYCGASAITRFIPFSQQSGRCGGAGYRFCDVYLSLSRPAIPDPLTVPEDLFVAANHLWLHAGPNGACHVGIDGFLARMVGQVERIALITVAGVHRPSAVLSVHGVDWPITFPNPLLIAGANLYLRSNPARLTADPYGSGWLFEGWEPNGGDARAGLRSGAEARQWMEFEVQRLDRAVHELTGRHGFVNDGGSAGTDVLAHLGREEILHLLNSFFSPHRLWTDDEEVE